MSCQRTIAGQLRDVTCFSSNANQSENQSVLFLCGEVSQKSNKMTSLVSVIPKLYQEYTIKTSKKLKIIDAYLLYIFITAVIQFVYCCLVGTFPFNSFLSGFISTVSSFVLGGKLNYMKLFFMYKISLNYIYFVVHN